MDQLVAVYGDADDPLVLSSTMGLQQVTGTGPFAFNMETFELGAEDTADVGGRTWRVGQRESCRGFRGRAEF